MTEDTLTPPPPRERWMIQPTKDELRARIADLEAQNAALRSELNAEPGFPAPTQRPPAWKLLMAALLRRGGNGHG